MRLLTERVPNHPVYITGAYAWRTMRRNRIPLTLNSDLPGSNLDFFYGFHAAVRRQDKTGEPGAGWYPEQRLSPEEALRGYTSWSAYARFSEGVTGILEAGRWADLTVVDIDPLRVAESEPARLLSGRVLLTIVNGRVAFQR
jgi:predicted amidohydrolase YtcJ